VPTLVDPEAFRKPDLPADRTLNERRRWNVFPLAQCCSEVRTDHRRLAPSERLHELHPETVAGSHGTTAADWLRVDALGRLVRSVSFIVTCEAHIAVRPAHLVGRKNG
jgi:hypothetical protein